MRVTVNDFTYSENKLAHLLKKAFAKSIMRIDTDKLANETASYIEYKAKEHLIREDSIVTRTLYDSIEKRKIDYGLYEVTVDAPYAPIVEHGMGKRGDGTFSNPPRNVNVYALQRWAQLKFGLDEAEAKKVAFAVANTMKKEGMYAHPFFEPAIYSAQEWFKLNKDKLKRVIIKKGE